MATDPSASPTSPEELVALIVDPATPSDVCRWALEQLETLIVQTARDCARQLIADDQVRTDLVDESFRFVQQRLARYDPQKGHFLSWLRSVILHLGMTRRRAWNRRCRRYRPLPERELAQVETAANPGNRAGAALDLAFQRIREDLDRCSWPPSRAVDYFAVLLVFLRVEMVACCRRLGAAPIPGEAAERVVAWLPWRRPEEERRFRAGLLCLLPLWRGLAPRLEQGSGLASVLDVLNEAEPAGGPVVYNTLAQWCYRARVMASQRLGAEAWNDHGFARLLCSSVEEGP